MSKSIKIFLLFCSSNIILSSVAMDKVIINEIRNPSSVIFLDQEGNKVAIASKDGCFIGEVNYKEKKLFNRDKVIDQPVDHVIVSKNKKQLALSLSGNEPTQVLYNLVSREMIDIKGIQKSNVPLAFSPTSTTLYGFSEGALLQYDLTTKVGRLTYSFCEDAYPVVSFISCHPTIEGDLLYPYSPFVFKQGSKQIFIKTRNKILEIISVKYTPDETNLIIHDSMQNCWICNLNSIKKRYSFEDNCLAYVVNIKRNAKGVNIFNVNKEFMDVYPLIKDSQKKYISSVVHPIDCIVALLTTNGNVCYWDYARNKCIACTHTLSNIKQTGHIEHQLDISPDGKKLIIAFAENCLIIDVPNRDTFFDAYKCLYQMKMPKEIIHYILSILAVCYKRLGNKNFSYFDLKSLLQTKSISRKRSRVDNKDDSRPYKKHKQ